MTPRVVVPEYHGNFAGCGPRVTVDCDLRGRDLLVPKVDYDALRAVADELAGVAAAVAPIVRESGETGLDYALAKYREAVSDG